MWNPDNKKLYTQVSVKVRSQTHLETIVELIRSELPADDCGFIEKRMLEMQMYQENFEVYIQTLISHALDPNFLMEIFQEQGMNLLCYSKDTSLVLCGKLSIHAVRKTIVIIFYRS